MLMSIITNVDLSWFKYYNYTNEPIKELYDCHFFNILSIDLIRKKSLCQMPFSEH